MKINNKFQKKMGFSKPSGVRGPKFSITDVEWNPLPPKYQSNGSQGQIYAPYTPTAFI